MKNIFPSIIAALFLCASVLYIIRGDYGRALYFFASMLTGVSAAFLIR